ncbi:MAG: prolyl oligopeptidase family serine peptidase [Acidobacteriota bacterium]|nr:prolyl oligopeptidase family serine peptidase [Acidobacteriota bacterium]
MFARFAFSLLLVLPLVAEKRPLNQGDYDSWRHIQNQVLSADGQFLAYALFPQQGDGEVVIRDLKTGKELRQPIGELPPPPPPNYSNPQAEELPPPPPGIALRFTPDSRFLVFSAFPPRAVVEQAKREKRKPEDMPKGDLGVVNLSSGAVFRAGRVKDFQLPSEAGDFVAYLQLPEPPLAAAKAPVPTDKAPESKAKKLVTGDLVLRDLSTATERRFPQVAEYSLAKNGRTLVYAVAAPNSDASGVYAISPLPGANPAPLLTGNGKYNKLAWDEDQTCLVFLSDRDDAKAQRPRFELYTWDRHSPSAVELVSSEAPGMPQGWTISDKAALQVAKGGSRIFFGTAPHPPAPKQFDPNLPEDERVSVDLWSWTDDYIQPMQKIRAGTERSRSYRAMYDLKTKKFVQLADPAMNDISPSEDGLYAIGNDDRAYRRLEEYEANYLDSYVVNTATGERKLVAQKHINRLTWSPTSKYAIYFDGKDWISVATADGRATNLTSKLGVSFANEQSDIPGLPDSYRLAGWTPDGKYVLIYDRYDVWCCSPAGDPAVDLTQGFGRRNRLQFRIIRFETDDPKSKWIDLQKPLLLRAENDETRDTGFYSLRAGVSEAPKKLVFAAKNFAPPIKARHADVYITAASTFSDYPDLLVTDGSFRPLKKVTDANPQLADFLWGTAELVHFNSTDGVPLEATLYKPADFDPKKKYPMLVYIYERLTQSVNNFIEPRPANVINPSFYASNGYLVLEPDIAYKIGYPGQSALNCVLPAIQAVVNQGFVEENAIGIQGHSWGGYQIAYMITRTNRFRAASAGAPVADMISAYDGIRWGPGIPRQFQYERTQSRIGGSVWQYPLRYIENSPIFMADRVNTPLLMIHNDADDAVPWYQGIEYFLALRRLNKEVYMFTYNGEPHNLRRRADQKDYSVRLQQYFDYYLKGAPEPDWMKHGIPYLEKPGAAVSADEDTP